MPRIKTEPMTDERLAFGRERGYTADSVLPDLEAERVKRILLFIGGEMACIQGHDEDHPKILKRGQRFKVRGCHRVKGAPSQCHFNAAMIWSDNRDNADLDAKICTGYALSRDGCWRQHSWLVGNIRRVPGTVIETTMPRVAYFGFVLDDDEADQFYFDNL